MNIPDYPALRDYALANASKTDAEIVAAVNTDAVPYYGAIGMSDIINYLATVKKQQSFITWANNPPAGAGTDSIEAARNLLYALDHPGIVGGWDLSDAPTYATVTAFLDALVDPAGDGSMAGPLDAQDKQTLLALATRTRTQAEAWGWSSAGITVNDLVAARVMP